MVKIQFEILGKPWTLRALKTRGYKKNWGTDSVAITDINKRTIDLSPEGRDFETLVHELVHAYLGEMATHSANLEDDQVEEVCCELFAKRGYELLAKAEELTTRVQASKG